MTPQLSIHGQPVSLNLLKSVRFSVESVNARDIKSVFAKNDLTLVKNGSNELQFTVPASGNHQGRVTPRMYVVNGSCIDFFAI